MAAPERYDHPQYTVRMNHFIEKADPPGSATTFAMLRSSMKAIVHSVRIIARSAASLAALSWTVVKQGPSITVLTLGTLTTGWTTHSAGSLPSTSPTSGVITLTTNNTLHSIGELIGLRLNDATGKFDVLWEYSILPDAAYTG